MSGHPPYPLQPSSVPAGAVMPPYGSSTAHRPAYAGTAPPFFNEHGAGLFYHSGPTSLSETQQC
jgi:hypothetical protein